MGAGLAVGIRIRTPQFQRQMPGRYKNLAIRTGAGFGGAKKPRVSRKIRVSEVVAASVDNLKLVLIVETMPKQNRCQKFDSDHIFGPEFEKKTDLVHFRSSFSFP